MKSSKMSLLSAMKINTAVIPAAIISDIEG